MLISPYSMRTRPEDPAREPDLLFVTQDHLSRLTPEKLEGPADLVIEVVSESSILRDYEDKFIGVSRDPLAKAVASEGK